MALSNPKIWLAGSALLALTACDEPFDFDLRSYGNGFDTSDAMRNIASRPRADNRGVISYSGYQVAVAQRGDTVTDVANRLGIDAGGLARYNAIAPDVTLRRGEIIALPSRVAEPSPATGAATTGPIQPPSQVDVTELASSAIDRADTQTVNAANLPQTGREPIRHQVERGETAYSVARLYNVPVRNLAEWNSLGADLNVREGQFLLIPVAAETPIARATDPTAPGVGTSTPTPPSAATALPDEASEITAPTATPAPETPSPNLGETQTAPTRQAQMIQPASGNIIRAYSKGRNEGIDIGASAGSNVRAADAGTVAAVTKDTNGVTIVVIKHTGDLLTVYTNVEDLTVARGSSVSRGQTIGKVRAGDPSFVHFEVRRGLESVDPQPFLN
ncbi:MAG: peptidoglycan DD-metalloendopeptidase family protein [Paracoccaceae bacterium]|nr:peptidoglycan DD-metalloendopeptidase family protein [Paracoccaceae bacterium]